MPWMVLVSVLVGIYAIVAVAFCVALWPCTERFLSESSESSAERAMSLRDFVAMLVSMLFVVVVGILWPMVVVMALLFFRNNDDDDEEEEGSEDDDV